MGAGSWGTAFSLVLADAGNEVRMWGRRAELCDAINSTRENPDYLPGVVLPAGIAADPDPAKALEGAHVVVVAVPSQQLRENLTPWVGLLEPDAVLLSLMKGVEVGTTKRMSEVIGDVTGAGRERVAVLSGPNLAKEIARREPAASVVACADAHVAKMLQQRCHSPASVPTRPSTCSAASSAGPTRTSWAWPSAWPSGSASATTPPRR